MSLAQIRYWYSGERNRANEKSMFCCYRDDVSRDSETPNIGVIRKPGGIAWKKRSEVIVWERELVRWWMVSLLHD